MTRFAQPMVIRCPSCNWHLLQCQLSSYSFRESDLRVWTDGVTNAGYENVKSPLLQCPLCQNPFWKIDAQKVSRFSHAMDVLSGRTKKEQKKEIETNWLGIPNNVENAVECDTPTIGDWLTILNGSVALTAGQESIVRRKIWRKGNDHLRLRSDGSPCRKTPLFSDAFSKQNLLALLDLHDRCMIEDPAERAEILRQLGRFEESKQVLDGIKEEDSTIITAKIRQLSDERIDTLQSVK